MSRMLPYLPVVLFLAIVAFAQPPQLELDIPIADLPDSVRIADACAVPDGIVAQGSREYPDDVFALILVKFDYQGELQWWREYDPGFISDFHDIEAAPNGGVALLVNDPDDDDEMQALFFDAWGYTIDYDGHFPFDAYGLTMQEAGFIAYGTHRVYMGDDFGWSIGSDIKRERYRWGPGFFHSIGPSLYGSRYTCDVIPAGVNAQLHVYAGVLGYMPVDLWSFVSIGHFDLAGELLAEFDMSQVIVNMEKEVIYADGFLLRDQTFAGLYRSTDVSYPDFESTRIIRHSLDGTFLGYVDFPLWQLSEFTAARDNTFLLLSQYPYSWEAEDSLTIRSLSPDGEMLGEQLLAVNSDLGGVLLPLPNGGNAVLYVEVQDDDRTLHLARFLPPEVPFEAEVLAPQGLVEWPSTGGSAEIQLRGLHTRPAADTLVVDLELARWGVPGDSFASFSSVLPPGEEFLPPPVTFALDEYEEDGFYTLTMFVSGTDPNVYATDRLLIQKGPITGAGESDTDAVNNLLPNNPELEVWPNPFNARAFVKLTLRHSGNVQLELVNLLGQSVALLHHGQLPAGEHSFEVDGSSLSSGLYLLRLGTRTGQTASAKLLLMK